MSHAHGPNCAHEDEHNVARFPAVDHNRIGELPEELIPEVNGARANLYLSSGRGLPEPIDIMTVRREGVPDTAHLMEVSSIILLLSRSDPNTRGHITSFLRKLIGIDTMKPTQMEESPFWEWNIGFRSTLEFKTPIEIIREVTKLEPVQYARMAGIFEKGLWIIETLEDPKEDFQTQFVVCGGR